MSGWMSKFDFLQGAYCPLIVPFRDGKIDFETYGKLIERQIVEGSHGLLVNATSGEPTTSFGEQWMQFAAVTSNVPFAAIVAGKNRLGPAVVEIGVWRPVVAIVVYAVAFYLHGRVGPPLT